MYVAGKLTVTGLVDPTGLVLDIQGGGTPAGMPNQIPIKLLYILKTVLP